MRQTEQIDYDALAKQAEEVRPAMITAGASAYPRFLDYPRLRQIADSVGALLFIDMAHIAGLVAGGRTSEPDAARAISSPRRRTRVCADRAAVSSCARNSSPKRSTRCVFPGIQGGPLMHVIAAKAGLFSRSAPTAVPRISATGGDERQRRSQPGRQTWLSHRFRRHRQSSHAGRSAAERDQRQGKRRKFSTAPASR